MRLSLLSAAFVACILSGGVADAQVLAPAPAPVAAPTNAPAGGLPEIMPFFVPYGAPISVEKAERIVALVVAEAHKHATWRFAVSVVDPSGNLVYFYKMDDTQLAAVEISQGKARTSARFRRETRVFYNAFEAGHAYLETFPGLVASPGGFPLIEDGKIIGGLGCSGGTSDQDASVCTVGAASLK